MKNAKDAIFDGVADANNNDSRKIFHYIYVSTRQAALRVSRKLVSYGYSAVERPSADGEDWLVLASHDAVITDELIASTRSLMESSATEVGGEYDGWEIEIAEGE